MSPSLLVRLLFVFVLLFAQTGSLLHGISHIEAARTTGSEHTLPHDKFCEQCVAYTQIGGTVSSIKISLAIDVNNIETLNPIVSVSGTHTEFAAFAARAPPHTS